MKNVKLLMNRVVLGTKKYSPELLMGVGIAGVVASTVVACKATLKASDIITEAKEDLEKIKSVAENPEYADRYSEEDLQKDTTILYTQTGLKIAKAYLPAVGLGIASVACLVSSHNVLRKRNLALAAAYTTIDKSFKDYRKRVTDRFGEEVERQIRHNIKAVEIEETVVDEDGNETVVKKTVEVGNINGCSDYARYFDESCAHWDKDPEYNLVFLRAQQQYANDLLRTKGHLFLNEVYDMLGIPRTKAGQVVGWYYNEKNPTGDNYVDFGIYDVNVQSYRNDYANETIGEERRDFVNGYRKSVLLDFNVDGNIWDLI